MLAERNGRMGTVARKLRLPRFAPPSLLAHAMPYLLLAALFALQWALLPQAGGTHLKLLANVTPSTVASNAAYYLHTVRGFFPFRQTFPHAQFASTAATVCVLPFLLCGFVRHMAEKPILAIYTLGAVGILLLWPARQGIRFLFPVMPALVVFAGLGVKDFVTFVGSGRIASFGVVIEILAVLTCIGIYVVRGRLAPSDEHGAYSADAKELYAAVLRQTPPTARIIFFKPRVLYLETGRLGFKTSSIRRLRDADYLVLCRDGYGTFSYDIESQYPAESARLNLVFENSTFKLYEIPPDSRAELEQIWYNAGDQETP